MAVEAGQLDRKRLARDRQCPEHTVAHEIGHSDGSLNAFDESAHQLGQIALQSGAGYESAQIGWYAQGDTQALNRNDDYFKAFAPRHTQFAWRITWKAEGVLDVEHVLVAAAYLSDPATIRQLDGRSSGATARGFDLSLKSCTELRQDAS